MIHPRRALLALLLAASPAAAEEALRPTSFVEIDCRYLTRYDPEAVPNPGPSGKLWFPDDDVFRPLLADMKQPRVYLGLRNVQFQSGGLGVAQDDNITSAPVALGKDLGIWRRSQRHRCDGVQVNLLGAVFSQFNLDTRSDDLINSDFLVGPAVTLRRGIVSARLRLYHQSSHLGDEFLLENPGVDRVNLSFEALDGLISIDGRWWRIYAGGGYIVSSDTDLDEGLAQAGFELRGLRWRWQSALCTAVFGTDLQSFEAQDWDVTTSVMGGIELSDPASKNRFRVLLAYLNGNIPFGQFFTTEKVETYGLQLAFDF